MKSAQPLRRLCRRLLVLVSSSDRDQMAVDNSRLLRSGINRTAESASSQLINNHAAPRRNLMPARFIGLARRMRAGVGDFLGKGQADLVLENTNTGAHVIWILDGGVYAYSILLSTVANGWHLVGAGDFDGDGQADLVWETTTTGQRGIWLLKNGIFQTSYLLATVSTAWHIVNH